MKLSLRFLVALLLVASVAHADVTVTLDDFENLAESPWGAGAQMRIAAAEGHTGKGASITVRNSGENLAIIKPCDVPEGMTRLTLWVRGSADKGFRLQAVFKDRQGFPWMAGEQSLEFTGWKQLAWDLDVSKLKTDWRLGWHKRNWEEQQARKKAGEADKAPPMVYEMTPPLRFFGFRVLGPQNATTTVLIDDLAITAAGTSYVHLPQSVLRIPASNALAIDVSAGAAPINGQVQLRLVSRNDQPLSDSPVQVAVDVSANSSRRIATPIKLDRTGLYLAEISGDGISGTLQKQIQVISALNGVEGFAAYQRQPKPFTTDIPNSPRQTRAKPWLNDASQPMMMYVSELSPAWLIKNNATDRYLAFASTQQWGLGAPTFIAIPTNGRAVVQRAGQPISAALLGRMDRSWVLAWFQGAQGYTDWDSPYLVVLQHRPRAMKLDANGLAMEFADKAGYLAIMPLYGGYKPPQGTKTLFVDRGLAPKDVLPSRWASGLPDDVRERCDYWARISKAFPVDCDERFSVDGDDLVVKSKFEYLTIKDDWNTEPLKFAPIPHVLGMCIWGKTFPVSFDQKVTDPMYPTVYGPLMGIEGADEYTYRMHVLQYVHEVEDLKRTDNSPAARAAREILARSADHAATIAGRLERINEPNLCWGIYGGLRWDNSNLLYAAEPNLLTAAQIMQQRFYNNQLLFRGQYDEWPGKSELAGSVSRTFLFMSGPGFGFQGDAGKITMDMYYTAWLYGYATGDYQLLADRWNDTISRLNCLPFTMHWAGVGRDAIAEGGDEAPPPMGMARVAYAVGDMDSYAYACYLFARELTHHYVKVGVGGDYFRSFQPMQPLVNTDWAGADKWPKAGPIPQRANLTNLWSESAGWVLGSPPDDKAMYSDAVWNGLDDLHGKKPRKDQPDVIPWAYWGSGQWVQKWSRFDAEDVYRFYYDCAREQCQKELNTWQKIEFPDLPKKKYENVSKRAGQDGYPGTPWRLMQLRADILHEPLEKITQMYPLEHWSDAQQTFYQAMVRASGERRTVRLIPKSAEPSPFQPGIQRDFIGNPSWGNPVQTPAGIIAKQKNAEPVYHWPVPTIYSAPAPKAPGGTIGTGHRWAYGYITPGVDSQPKSATQETINWVTDVYTWE